MSPIKYRANYPDDWPALALAVKAANDWICQACDKQCTRPGEPYAGASNVLTCAHAEPDSYQAEFVTLWALCVTCHLRMDARWGMFFRRRHARLRQRQAGQMYWAWAA